MRAEYAEKLARIVPREAIIFLIAIEYPEGEITGPPFLGFALTRFAAFRRCVRDQVLEDARWPRRQRKPQEARRHASR